MTGDYFRKGVAGLVLVLAVGGVYWRYQDTRPCVHPIMYTLGTVDGRFGISNENLLKDASGAVALWNKAAGRTLFAYDPCGALPLNLIYDNRQKTAQLGNAIQQTESSHESQKAAIAMLEATYEADLARYNQQVDYWNARGGAPPSTYTELQSEKAALNQELAQINTQVATFNAETRQANQVIATYNAGASSQFEEGEYVRDSSGARIDVYEFSSNTQLIRLLAHEFGHSLGLDHNQNTESVMYPINKSTSLRLSAEDLSALKKLCNLSS
jgi:hypothetical protein